MSLAQELHPPQGAHAITPAALRFLSAAGLERNENKSRVAAVFTARTGGTPSESGDNIYRRVGFDHLSTEIKADCIARTRRPAAPESLRAASLYPVSETIPL